MFADQALASLRIETYVWSGREGKYCDQALASLRIETFVGFKCGYSNGDQALASLRIETNRGTSDDAFMAIRLSRACGLKQIYNHKCKTWYKIRLSRACGLKQYYTISQIAQIRERSREPAE